MLFVVSNSQREADKQKLPLGSQSARGLENVETQKRLKHTIQKFPAKEIV